MAPLEKNQTFQEKKTIFSSVKRIWRHECLWKKFWIAKLVYRNRSCSTILFVFHYLFFSCTLDCFWYNTLVMEMQTSKKIDFLMIRRNSFPIKDGVHSLISKHTEFFITCDFFIQKKGFYGPKGSIMCQVVLIEWEIIMIIKNSSHLYWSFLLKNSKYFTYMELYFPLCRKSIFGRMLTHQEAIGNGFIIPRCQAV